MARFPDRLVDLRTEAHITQFELAKELEISRSRLSNYELGTRTPDFETLEAIADFFNVNIEYLLGFSNKRGPTADEMDSILSPRELELVRLYRSVPPEQQQIVFNMIRAAVNAQQ